MVTPGPTQPLDCVLMVLRLYPDSSWLSPTSSHPRRHRAWDGAVVGVPPQVRP